MSGLMDFFKDNEKRTILIVSKSDISIIKMSFLSIDFWMGKIYILYIKWKKGDFFR